MLPREQQAPRSNNKEAANSLRSMIAEILCNQISQLPISRGVLTVQPVVCCRGELQPHRQCRIPARGHKLFGTGIAIPAERFF